MRFRHNVQWTLIATLVLSLLTAACAAPTPEVVEVEEVPVEVEVEKEVEIEAPAPSGEVTFITQAGTLFDVKALTQAVNEFMSLYPDIKVDCTIVVPVGGWDQELARWAPELSTLCTLVVAQ